MIIQKKYFSKLANFNFFLCIGVAFEEGTALPTPKTVPFRLTRDLVDGMA